MSHTVALAGRVSPALLPSAPSDPFRRLLDELPVEKHTVPISGRIRTNATIVDADGGTTKLNGPGPVVTGAEVECCEAAVFTALQDHDSVSWLVLAGSLPPGFPVDWYVRMTATVRERFPTVRIAVDTSGEPLGCVGKHLGECAPDLLSPNATELAQLLGTTPEKIRGDGAGDRSVPVAAARQLVERGAPELLATLGGAGAVLVTRDGAWEAPSADGVILSTVGAGDSTIAGYLMAREDGADPATCLERAVAYGSAAASLPGTTLPAPGDLPVPAPGARRLW